jgi:hypothetical protein
VTLFVPLFGRCASLFALLSSGLRAPPIRVQDPSEAASRCPSAQPRDHGAALRTGRTDRGGQLVAFEREVTRDPPHVVEILQAAVRLGPEQHDLELLRHHGLGRVGEQARTSHRQQRWKVEFLRRRRDRVAEADVNLHVEPRVSEGAAEGHAHAWVVGVLDDRLAADRRGIKLKSVRVDRRGTGVAHHALEHGDLVGRTREQVDVPRGSEHGRVPRAHEERAFEHEAICVLGSRQPVQEALHGVELQQVVERPRPGARLVEQACAH